MAIDSLGIYSFNQFMCNLSNKIMTHTSWKSYTFNVLMLLLIPEIPAKL